MFHYFESIANARTGDALAGYFVGLVEPDPADVDGGSEAVIYADDAGTPIISDSGVENRAKVDTDGNVSLYAPVGTYHVDIYATDSTTKLKRILNIPLESGEQGDAASISIGTVTTLTAGSSATVTNSGTSVAAILDFGIPQGIAGSGTTF